MRLADRVFAPHYAAPMPRILITTAELRSSGAMDSEVLASLPAGEMFEVLELAGNHAWGVAPAAGIVGYIPAAALADPQ
ncbi:SH3 domain-containing protein [Sphingomonas psychrotolerans]|uniref:SH3 domain-containing protein n=1 Tax=Sphingomonas psychrotolerans TaxID=1327635 RepID=UPI001F305A89|nr:SH3 domain-containing protein [Sphingomonas psychrotolerans]